MKSHSGDHIIRDETYSLKPILYRNSPRIFLIFIRLDAKITPYVNKGKVKSKIPYLCLEKNTEI